VLTEINSGNKWSSLSARRSMLRRVMLYFMVKVCGRTYDIVTAIGGPWCRSRLPGGVDYDREQVVRRRIGRTHLEHKCEITAYLKTPTVGVTPKIPVRNLMSHRDTPSNVKPDIPRWKMSGAKFPKSFYKLWSMDCLMWSRFRSSVSRVPVELMFLTSPQHHSYTQIHPHRPQASPSNPILSILFRRLGIHPVVGSDLIGLS